MTHFIKKAFKGILEYKIISILALVAIAGGGYFAYAFFGGTSTEIRYAIAELQKGTLIVSVGGTGQVTTSNQVYIKAKASGDITAVNFKKGDEIKAGEIIAKIDDKDAQKAIRDAETNLETAQLNLEKLLEPADELSLLQSEHSFAQAQESKQSAEDSLAKSYEDGFNTVSNAFLNLPTVMTGLNDIFYSTTLTKIQQNIDWYADQVASFEGGAKAMTYKYELNSSYQIAKAGYDQNFNDYKATSRNSDKETIENIISETYGTTKLISDTVKKANNYVDYVYDLMKKNNVAVPSTVLTYQSNLQSYTGTTNSYLISLLSAKTSIENNKSNIINAERSIEEKTQSLANLKAGADALEIRSQKIAVAEKENALQDAQENLLDYYIRAPFDGIIAEIDVKKGDTVFSGAAVATIIAKQQLAEITLNEVDIAKIKLGQKATLTFDAVEGLSISGQVTEIDTIGAVSQGVVNYTVKIAFDTQDDRIKPGMSVSASIVTNIDQDVLVTPNAAVKSSGNNGYYIEILQGNFSDQEIASSNGVASLTLPTNQTVEIGLSNDTMTEILSGANEGDLVVTRTISPSTASTQQSQQNILQSLTGQRSTGGGAVRSISPGTTGR
ncbi:MAG: efflux RND transporter periplasmic adaptor subunit [Spirochaetia bacterium]|nr:MAG: efflux RND transporter periplasmic adaptor subunit [Spirochaetia bacterium]